MVQNTEGTEPTSLEALVNSVRVPLEEMIETRDPALGVALDERLPQPDRDWFESGG